MTKWFKAKRHTGFDKDKSIESNLRIMYRNTAKSLSRQKRWLRVGRQALALANVSTDPATVKKAKAVSKRAFEKLKKVKTK